MLQVTTRREVAGRRRDIARRLGRSPFSEPKASRNEPSTSRARGRMDRRRSAVPVYAGSNPVEHSGKVRLVTVEEGLTTSPKSLCPNLKDGLAREPSAKQEPP
jgi:hypothetical protein